MAPDFQKLIVWAGPFCKSMGLSSHGLCWMMGNTEMISVIHGSSTLFLLWFEFLLTFHFI